MHTFIYDKYGYLVEDEYAKEFTYKNWKFRLEANQKNEKELEELNHFIMGVDNLLFKRGVRIISTRDFRLSSLSEFGQLSLVGVNEFNVSISDIVLMHQHFISNREKTKPLISNIKEIWIEKTDIVENKILPSLKIDNYVYGKISISIIHALGLAENAIQYLQDISLDIGDSICEVTLTHKRINELTSYELLNPFNLIIDSPMRDIADLYNLDLINESNLDNILKNYQMDLQKASLLLARIIYPSSLFDMLEEHYSIKKDITKELLSYYSTINKKMKKINYIHNYLVNRYGIRPINWLSLN